MLYNFNMTEQNPVIFPQFFQETEEQTNPDISNIDAATQDGRLHHEQGEIPELTQEISN